MLQNNWTDDPVELFLINGCQAVDPFLGLDRVDWFKGRVQFLGFGYFLEAVYEFKHVPDFYGA
jgi:hypothetical protein